MSETTVSSKLKELHKNGFWLYVDSSQESQEILKEVEWLRQANMLTVSDLTEVGGFADGARLPRLARDGDIMSGKRLREFIDFLRELNDEFLQEQT